MKEKIAKYYEDFKTGEQAQKKIGEILQNDKYKMTDITPAEIQLDKLEIEKLINIHKACADFGNNKILIMEGENGIGKTLLTETITLLMNNFGRDALNKIVSRETRMRLDFKIIIDNNPLSHSIIVEKGKWSRLENGLVNLVGQTEIMNYYKAKGIDDIFRDLIKITDGTSYITAKLPTDFKIFFMRFYDITFADKIRKDVGDSIAYNKSDIDSLHGEKSGLVNNDGPNVINVEILSIEKELKANEGIEKEYINIVAKGSEVIVKLQDKIQKTEKKKIDEENLLEKVKTVIENKNIFVSLAEKQGELKKLEKELEKITDQGVKYENEITSLKIIMESSEKNIRLLEKTESKCDVCNSELSIIQKQLGLKAKKEKIENIEKNINALNDNIQKLNDIDTRPLQEEIGTCSQIVKLLAEINIKTQKNIDQILEKYQPENIQKEIALLVNEIREQNKQLNKLMEKNPKKRKEELESQLKERERLKSSLAVWNEKKNNYDINKDKIEEINKKIKIAEFQDEILNKVFDIFDKNKPSSFPIWYLNSAINDIEKEVNQELGKFKKLKLKLKINTEFKITVKGLNSKLLSEAELKILNFVFKLVIARQRFKKIPFMIIDSYKNGLDKNTLTTLKEVMNYYIKNEYINNIILTNTTDSEELTITGMEKI